MTKRRSFSDRVKATGALEALSRDRTAQEIAANTRHYMETSSDCWPNWRTFRLGQESRSQRASCKGRQTGGRKRLFVTRAKLAARQRMFPCVREDEPK